jgi:cell division protein FtsA
MNLPKISLPKLNRLMPQKGHTKSDIFVVVDVGSSAVRAAIVEIREGQVAILGKAEVAQDPEAMWGGMIGNLEALIGRMDDVITRASQQAGVTTEQMVLGLGGALVGGVTTLAHVNRPEPRNKINEKELELLLQQVVQSALGDAEEDVSQQMSLQKDDLRLVNSALTSISLDGYILASPVSFSGKEAEIGLFNAFVSASTLVALQKTLVDLNVDLAALASEPYAMAQALVSSAPKPQQVSALLVDVGAGTSSITLVQQGVVTGSAHFPVAGRSVTSAIAKLLDVPMEEAESLKRELASGKINDSQRHKLQRAVEKEMGVWLKGFKMSLISLQAQGSLPETIYVTGGGGLLPQLLEQLAGFSWQRVGWAQKPEVKRLELSQFSQLLDMSHVLHSDDVALASLALLIGRQYQEDVKVSEIFQKTLKYYAAV